MCRGADSEVLTTTVQRVLLGGSHLTMYAVIEEGRVKAVGCRVRVLSLGQATTAIVAERAPGMNATELRAVQGQLEQILTGRMPGQDALLWPEFAIFQNAAAMPSRHGSALLPLRALQELFETELSADRYSSGEAAPMAQQAKPYG